MDFIPDRRGEERGEIFYEEVLPCDDESDDQVGG